MGNKLKAKRKRKKLRQYGRVLVNGHDLGIGQYSPQSSTIELGPHIHDDLAKEPRHCDEYIDDETQPEVLRKFLDWARKPAHGHMEPQPWPELYADFKGKRVRVTMASRLGSIGWSDDLTRDMGYEHRGWVEQLSNFSDKP